MDDRVPGGGRIAGHGQQSVVEIGGAVNGDRVTECDRERAAVKGDGTADGAVAAQGAAGIDHHTAAADARPAGVVDQQCAGIDVRGSGGSVAAVGECQRAGAGRVQTTQAGELTGQGQGSAVGHVDGVGGTGVEDDAASREKGPNTFSLPDCLCFVTHSPPPTVMDYITDVTKGANHE